VVCNITIEITRRKKAVRVVSGRIDEILIDNIHVPRQYHAILETIPSREGLHAGNYYYNADSKKRVHYQVRMNFGQRHEPWVVGVESL
jgi:hypothetical protein